MAGRKVFSTIRRCGESILLEILSLFIPRDKHNVAIGSWSGMRYADNSRYLAEYINNNRKDLNIFWVGEKSIEKEVLKALPEAVFLYRNTFTANLRLLRCKYLFFSQMHNADISDCNVFRGATTCYLHHGMPIKKWGQDGLSQNVGNSGSLVTKIIQSISGANIKYDYFVTSSKLHDKTNCSGLGYKGCTMEKNVHSGTPRNDMYFNCPLDEIASAKQRYAELIGFCPEKKVLMYLPTYRRTNTEIFSFTDLTAEQSKALDAVLTQYDCVIIEKSHVAETHANKGKNQERIIAVPSELNVQEMMLFADVLISDYSGAYLDFLFLDRPIIHYAYDYQYYKDTDSGLYYEIDDFSAGAVAYNFEELTHSIQEALGGVDNYADKRKYVRNKYMSYESGHASEIILHEVIGGGGDR